MEPGNWFGEASLLDGLPRPHDVTAIEPSSVLVIGAPAFERLMRRTAFARALGALLCSRVRALYGLVEDAMLRSTSTRIARRLLSLARGDTTMAADARSRVGVSQEALAMMLGITRQTLSKELKVLARDGVLALGYGRIEVLLPLELEKRAARA
jgi:CRP-like cAMP-binding protein